MNRHIVLLLCCLFCLAVVAWLYLPGENQVAPEQLAELALTAGTVEQRSQAAAALSDQGPDALQWLRQVADESQDPPVQAICLQGLAKLWDYESMDLMLEVAESRAPLARGQAAQAVMRLTGRTRPYVATAPAAQRSLLVGYMRDDWQQIQEAPPEVREDLKRRLRESHEQSIEE